MVTVKQNVSVFHSVLYRGSYRGKKKNDGWVGVGGGQVEGISLDGCQIQEEA